MFRTRLARSFLVLAVTGAGLVAAPAGASAATTRYVVTRTDGSVYVAELTSGSAAELAGQPGIKIVEPDSVVSLDDDSLVSYDSVSGLDVPEGLDGAEAVAGTSCPAVPRRRHASPPATQATVSWSPTRTH
jgi:hypothetical protein